MPSELNARTRQNSVPLGSEFVASCEGVVVAAYTSGRLKLAESSTSIVYQAAFATSLQSKVNGSQALREACPRLLRTVDTARSTARRVAPRRSHRTQALAVVNWPSVGLTDEFSAPCRSVRRLPTHGRMTPCEN